MFSTEPKTFVEDSVFEDIMKELVFVLKESQSSSVINIYVI